MKLEEGKEVTFNVGVGRQSYLVQIEGTSVINNINLEMRDGMEIVEEKLSVKSEETSHILIIEMKKS